MDRYSWALSQGVPGMEMGEKERERGPVGGEVPQISEDRIGRAFQKRVAGWDVPPGMEGRSSGWSE